MKKASYTFRATTSLYALLEEVNAMAKEDAKTVGVVGLGNNTGWRSKFVVMCIATAGPAVLERLANGSAVEYLQQADGRLAELMKSTT